jgi:hypothetical protein
MVVGRPMYSLKFLNTKNKEQAVNAAPKLSIRKSVVGFLEKELLMLLRFMFI